MAKKKDEKDVLVVRDEKTGEISVVAGLNADGTPKRTPAKAENAQSFLQFDRHGDVLDNFFKNFFRQCKEPSRFGFYRIAADQVDSMLGVMKDLLQHPYQNKQILAPHKIDTFPYQQQVMEEQAAQQTEKQEPQKQENMEQQKEQQQDNSEQTQGKRGYRPIDESKINWQELEDRWGVKRDDLEKSGDLTKMLHYGKSDLVKVKPTFGGESFELDARLSFKKDGEGNVSLVPHFIRKEQKLDVQPILGIEIPKGNGKTRLLGVPTTTERVLQQALAQTIAPLFEPEFSNYSYGFRPHKNARQAVGQSRDYIHSGLNHIVDIDLKNFFDEVDHCLLLNLIYQKVKCKATMQLIRKWLRAPIKINGKLRKRRKGVPQGSPLSPLLSNILLHQLDKEMTRRGHKFVRYADDFSIYCKSHNQAKATRVVIEKFLKNKLKLTINEEKSGIRKPIHFTILGFGFVPTYEKGSKNQYQLIVSEKAWKKLKERLKTITRKTTPATFEERIAKIKEVQRGWLNYFQGTSILGKLRDLDGWLRNRLRYCIWHHWKKPERKRKNLIRLGVDQDHAYAWSRTRKGGWAIAQSPILGTTITLQRLKKRGYVSLTELHLQLNPSLCEPPST